jgi:hypothetical protein
MKKKIHLQLHGKFEEISNDSHSARFRKATVLLVCEIAEK